MQRLVTAKRAYVGLGSNLGDRVANVREAISRLDAVAGCSVVARSSLYLTKPVGLEDQPDFVNAVVGLDTTLSPRGLLDACSQIEREMGRERTIRWGPRVIDLDVLIYEGEEIDEPGLTIPHPRMMERAFVLVPLAEIAPDLILPSGRTAASAAITLGELRRMDSAG